MDSTLLHERIEMDSASDVLTRPILDGNLYLKLMWKKLPMNSYQGVSS